MVWRGCGVFAANLVSTVWLWAMMKAASSSRCAIYNISVCAHITILKNVFFNFEQVVYSHGK